MKTFKVGNRVRVIADPCIISVIEAVPQASDWYYLENYPLPYLGKELELVEETPNAFAVLVQARNALLRAYPQLKGVLVIQDVKNAIDAIDEILGKQG